MVKATCKGGFFMVRKHKVSDLGAARAVFRRRQEAEEAIILRY